MIYRKIYDFLIYQHVKFINLLITMSKDNNNAD